MSDFLKKLRKQHEEEGRIPKLTTERVKHIVESEWEEFLREDEMHPEGATLRILSEHGFLEEDITFFFQTILTLLKLNLAQPIPHWETVTHLKNEIGGCLKILDDETILEFEETENFNKEDYK